MNLMNADEFYQHLLAGKIPGHMTGFGRRPFHYDRSPGDRAAKMVLYDKPIVHFTVLEDRHEEFLVRVSVPLDLSVKGVGRHRDFWIAASDLDELHEILVEYGERAVRPRLR